jgi:hypothetical protein
MRNNYSCTIDLLQLYLGDTIVLNLVLNLVSVTHTKFSRVSCFQETLETLQLYSHMTTCIF